MENQNYNLDDFNELDDLRQQIKNLKDKVDQQGRLNEEHSCLVISLLLVLVFLFGRMSLNVLAVTCISG